MTSPFQKDVHKLAQVVQQLRGRQSGRADLKLEYHRLGRKVLRAMAKSWALEQYDVRSCMGGPAVSGEIILHTPHLYLQINADSGVSTVMYRTCEGMKDYRGGPNQWTSVELLADYTTTQRLMKTARATTRYELEAMF